MPRGYRGLNLLSALLHSDACALAPLTCTYSADTPSSMPHVTADDASRRVAVYSVRKLERHDGEHGPYNKRTRRARPSKEVFRHLKCAVLPARHAVPARARTLAPVVTPSCASGPLRVAAWRALKRTLMSTMIVHALNRTLQGPACCMQLQRALHDEAPDEPSHSLSIHVAPVSDKDVVNCKSHITEVTQQHLHQATCVDHL